MCADPSYGTFDFATLQLLILIFWKSLNWKLHSVDFAVDLCSGVGFLQVREFHLKSFRDYVGNGQLGTTEQLIEIILAEGGSLNTP